MKKIVFLSSILIFILSACTCKEKINYQYITSPQIILPQLIEPTICLEEKSYKLNRESNSSSFIIREEDLKSLLNRLNNCKIIHNQNKQLLEYYKELSEK